MLRHSKLCVSLSVVALLFVAAAFPQALTSVNPESQDMMHRLLPPFWLSGSMTSHPLGTDALGRDILGRIVYGARISGLISVSAVLTAGSVGTALGLGGAYYGGTVDLFVGVFTDLMLSLPFMLTALLVVAVVGSGLWNIALVLAISSWPTYARISRTETLSVREREFILGARSCGAGSARIILRHILPNIFNSLLVVGSLEVGRLMISEAFLSFLGLGVPPPIPSWGSMIAEGRDYLLQQWWVSTFPGLAIFLSVTAVNLAGDGLRSLLDPRLTPGQT